MHYLISPIRGKIKQNLTKRIEDGLPSEILAHNSSHWHPDDCSDRRTCVCQNIQTYHVLIVGDNCKLTNTNGCMELHAIYTHTYLHFYQNMFKTTKIYKKNANAKAKRMSRKDIIHKTVSFNGFSLSNVDRSCYLRIQTWTFCFSEAAAPMLTATSPLPEKSQPSQVNIT